MLLTIGIPTYNRSHFLKENLSSLLPQLKGLENEVELIISDNASNDNTEDMIKEATYIYSFPIKYYRQTENLGAERNGMWVIEHAQGKYVYLMGDDDILSPNFISIVLPLIKSDLNYDSIYWNRLTGDMNCSNNEIYDSKFTGSVLDELNPSEFILRVMRGPNFISSVIFKKSIIERGLKYYKDDYLGYKICGPLYWGLVLSGGLNVYYYFPLVIQRNAPKAWTQYWPHYFISSMSNLFYDLDSEIPGIYDKWRSELRGKIKDVLPYIMLYRGYYRQNEIKKKLAKHLTRYEYFKMMLYLYLPFCRLLSGMKKRLISVFIKILQKWK